MKRRLSWGVLGVTGVVDEVPDLFMMTIMKRRVRCSTNFFFSDVLASFYPCPKKMQVEGETNFEIFSYYL